MDTSEIQITEPIRAAINEIETTLKKYDLCGFYSLSTPNQGYAKFSFRTWSGMAWGIGDDGYSFTEVKFSMNNDVRKAVELLDNSLTVSGYFQDVLAHNSSNMQMVLDDLNTCFNTDRMGYKHKSGDLH